jgi:hypothetical protein
MAWKARQISIFCGDMRFGAAWLAFAFAKPCKFIFLNSRVNLKAHQSAPKVHFDASNSG